MQLLTPPETAGTSGDTRSPAAPARPRGPRTGLVVGLGAGLGLIGLGAGALLGSSSPTRYETTVAVEVDQVLSFDPWEANLQTARFAQAILRPDLQQAAAESVGLDRGDLSEIQANRNDGSPIVQVTLLVDDPAGAGPAIEALVDATLRDLVESERVPEQLIVDELQPQLDALDAERDAMWDEVDVAPGTDLTQAYNQARYNLETATAEQQVATEQWRLDQLPGIIGAAQAQISAIEPVLDRWYDTTTRSSDLEDRLNPAQDRLQELQLGLDVLDSGGHRSDPVVTEVSSSSDVLRWAAGGAAIGLAIALAVLGLLTLVAGRRRA